jgi:hypothetical protein
VNLVHEAMHREKEEDDGKKKPGKAIPKDGRARMVATLLTWLLLNLIWLYASDAVAVNEVHEHGGQINRNYLLDVPDMMGMDRETPVGLTCDYAPRNASSPVVNVELSHVSPDESIEILWEGESTEACPDMSLSLEPGKHYFTTRVVMEDGQADIYPSRNLSAEMDLGMRLWQPFRTEGFVAANVLGLVLGIVDRTIRQMAQRRKDALVRNMPLHTRRQQEEWEQIVQSVSGGDAVDVEGLVMGPTGSADESMEVQRRRMREQFAAQSSEADGDIAPFEDEDAIDFEDELGEGTTEGLTGAVEEDRSIRTVGDLWRRLGGSSNEKKKGKR